MHVSDTLCPRLDPHRSLRAASGVRAGDSQVPEGVLTQARGQPGWEAGLQEAARGPPQHLAQDRHARQGGQLLETSLQRDEKQAAVHARALQGLFPNLSHVNDDAFQLLQAQRKPLVLSAVSPCGGADRTHLAAAGKGRATVGPEAAWQASYHLPSPPEPRQGLPLPHPQCTACSEMPVTAIPSPVPAGIPPNSLPY